ncbi:proline-rich receptor-like protein kinase PERK9 [Triticum dicoccoides]|uniref:proline-rich receptor-like protein kinase PERK9 n=1 Tax=Triticum dicoccoides TaxID=85692 RepID=UPI0018902697|nr:proline-rich receptor-like protein kinase PERK9 [Triticum dicoccoides]
MASRRQRRRPDQPGASTSPCLPPPPAALRAHWSPPRAHPGREPPPPSRPSSPCGRAPDPACPRRLADPPSALAGDERRPSSETSSRPVRPCLLPFPALSLTPSRLSSQGASMARRARISARCRCPSSFRVENEAAHSDLPAQAFSLSDPADPARIRSPVLVPGLPSRRHQPPAAVQRPLACVDRVWPRVGHDLPDPASPAAPRPASAPCRPRLVPHHGPARRCGPASPPAGLGPIFGFVSEL